MIRQQQRPQQNIMDKKCSERPWDEDGTERMRGTVNDRKKKKDKEKILKDDIPEDVVIDILSRLPVKSLLRFKCVGKSWCDLIRDPQFVAKHHLKQTQLNNISVFVFHQPEKVNCMSLLSSSKNGTESELLRITETICLPYVSPLPLISGPCNGLLCLYWKPFVYLWNPSTRELKPLPPSTVMPSPPSPPKMLSPSVGFGFDHKTNDYKVLKIFCTTLKEPRTDVYQAELYSLRSNSWREIPTIANISLARFLYNNGNLYWMFRDIMLCFCFATEVFSEMPLPVSYKVCHVKLAILNGSLAVLSSKRRTCDHVDVWVITEYGGNKSWVKQSSIGPLSGVVRPLGLWKNGRLVFEDFQGQVVLYDPKSQKLNNLHLFSYHKYYSQIANYVESLVPINGRPEDEDENKCIFRTRFWNMNLEI